jgi:hypothetical protein
VAEVVGDGFWRETLVVQDGNAPHGHTGPRDPWRSPRIFRDRNEGANVSRGHNAILSETVYDAQSFIGRPCLRGTLEKFRPYTVPSEQWLLWAARRAIRARRAHPRPANVTCKGVDALLAWVTACCCSAVG